MNEFRELTRSIAAFRDRRNWKQFHSLRNLAAGLSIEAAELQEVLLWKSDAEVDSYLRSAVGRGRLTEEVADILVFVLLFCHEAAINPAAALAAYETLNGAGQRLVDGRLLNVVLVLMLTTAILGPVLTERFALRMLPKGTPA
jgi:NTP pyrophosphatase (non-canonical NTP hydrolase)